jgi:hypothetical protein
MKGNSGIVFDAPKTVYWNLAGAQNWTANGWATSSGGSPSVNNFPLPQDTAIINDSSAITSLTFASATNVGSIDMSNRTLAASLVSNSGLNLFNGDFKVGSGITLSGTALITFASRAVQTIFSAGKTFTQPINLNSPSGYLNLGDALTSSTTLTIANGTFNTNNYSLSCTGNFAVTTTNIREINLGSSAVSVNSVQLSNPATLSFNAGTSTITMTGGLTFTGGGKTFNNVILAASKGISGSNKFNTLSNSTQPISISWTSGTTNTFNNFNLSGTSGNLVTNMSTTPGQKYELVKGSAWAIGSNSIDQGNNTGLSFNGSSPNYLFFKDAIANILVSGASNFFAFF